MSLDVRFLACPQERRRMEGTVDKQSGECSPQALDVPQFLPLERRAVGRAGRGVWAVSTDVFCGDGMRKGIITACC